MELNHNTEIIICNLEETDSTNTWLKSSNNMPEGCLFKVAVAQFQTGGYGQKGNSWDSAFGQNLLFSILSHPTFIDASCQFCLSEAISCSILDTLAGLFPDIAGGFSIKWPNDIYWQNSKLAGILIENELSGHVISQSITGIGLNVNQQSFASDAPNPVSLYNITGKISDRNLILQTILEHFSEYCRKLYNGDTDSLHSRYMRYLFRRDGFHTFRDSIGIFQAKIDSIRPNGILVLQDTDHKKREYEFKQVSYILD